LDQLSQTALGPAFSAAHRVAPDKRIAAQEQHNGTGAHKTAATADSHPDDEHQADTQRQHKSRQQLAEKEHALAAAAGSLCQPA
jgi:hypothetical protein